MRETQAIYIKNKRGIIGLYLDIDGDLLGKKNLQKTASTL